jgi:hypothetical protein
VRSANTVGTARSGRGCSARASARGVEQVAAQGAMPSPGIIAASSTRAIGTRGAWAAPESDDGTRLFFPSRAPGRGVHQPNVVVSLRRGRVPLRALRPRPADRWSSRASPRCSPRPFLRFHINTLLFIASRIPFLVVSHKFDRNASTRLVLAQSTPHSARRQRPSGCSPTSWSLLHPREVGHSIGDRCDRDHTARSGLRIILGVGPQAEGGAARRAPLTFVPWPARKQRPRRR